MPFEKNRNLSMNTQQPVPVLGNVPRERE